MHRFLDWTANDHPGASHGITEADEICLPESNKGSRHIDRKSRKRGESASKQGLSKKQACILIARDRAGDAPLNSTQLFHLSLCLELR